MDVPRSGLLVSSYQPVPKASRMRTAFIVDKVKWKKTTGANAALGMYVPPILIPSPGITTFPSQANATGTLGDGEYGWDEGAGTKVACYISLLMTQRFGTPIRCSKQIGTNWICLLQRNSFSTRYMIVAM
jgi:hypothetical protein